MPRSHRTVVSNILVIGSGGAGLRAAIAAHETGAEVVVVGKRLRKDAHTVLAAGGINTALGTVDPEDSWEQHFADTLQDGYFLNDARTVEIMAREAPRAVQELDDWGCEFARTPDSQLDQRFFGAHTYRRTCYAGDYTGRTIVETLAGKVSELGIPVHEFQYISRLLVHEDECFGAMAFDLESGERTVYLADAVILAAGGHTRIWRRSSSRRDENTGDGMYLALQAGCRLADMELVQFHPTGMVAPEEMAGTLVTEAVRGEGGRLYNANDERYMVRYDAERMELSTRDRVALANYTEIREGRGGPNGGVFLDISHHDKSYILEKLPRMYRQFMEWRLMDISEEPMEVAPTAHYSMGGVVVDPETMDTDVSGLYAAGECTTGLHGANRLGGNSLTETLVFGRRAGEAAAKRSASLEAQLRNRQAIAAAHEDLDQLTKEGDEMARPLQRAVRDMMWAHCGVLRSEEGIKQGIDKLEAIKAAAVDVDVRPTSQGLKDLALALDLRGSIYAAEATLRSTLERRESRGAHQHEDVPQTDPDLVVNFVVTFDDQSQIAIGTKPVTPVPEALQAWVAESEASDLEVKGRLLE